MSLLDDPPHVIRVQPRQRVPNRYGAPGEPVPVGAPYDVACAVQPLTAEEAADRGVSTETTRRVIVRRWPAGLHDQLTHDGREWQQHGEANPHRMSARTGHDELVIRAIGTPLGGT